MKLAFKILLIVFCVVIAGAAAGYTYLLSAYPDVENASDIKIETTGERLTRGKYLFTSVSGCLDCHSQRDFTKLYGPVIPGTEGMGGMLFDEKQGLPGKFYAKNITPAGLSGWSDGEILRAVTQGVNKDGEPMFPIHPYLVYGKMDKEDIYSIIAYLKTLKPIINEVPKSEPKFPVNLIMRTMPTKAQFENRPDPLDKIASGKYLVEAADCIVCHTQSTDKGELITELLGAGGREFPLPWNSVVRSTNITPDRETGLGSWTKEMFIKKFKQYAESNYTSVPVDPGDFNSVMPWSLAANMTEEDLGNIYEYLMTLKPITNKVAIFSTR